MRCFWVLIAFVFGSSVGAVTLTVVDGLKEGKKNAVSHV